MLKRMESGFEAFHASTCDCIASFRPGTHFGTRAAAVERSGARKYAGMEVVLYEVEIAAGDFLLIHDDGTPHDAAYLVSAIRSADRKMLHRFASDEILCSAAEEGEAAALTKLANAMAGQGILGLVYENAAEDDDSLSWVVFDPSKVAIKSMVILDRSAPMP